MNIEQHVEFYGELKQGFSGSSKTGIPAKTAGLNHCKFCQENDQLIRNTHTPYYWIACPCGIELKPNHLGVDGNTYSDLDLDHNSKDLNAVKHVHNKALQHIINKWNQLTTNSP